MKVTITFLGGEETGNVDCTTWGSDTGQTATPGGALTFPVRTPVVIDTDEAESDEHRKFLEHVIKKARNNRFFKVAEGEEADEPEEDPPPRRGGWPKGRPRNTPSDAA